MELTQYMWDYFSDMGIVFGRLPLNVKHSSFASLITAAAQDTEINRILGKSDTSAIERLRMDFASIVSHTSIVALAVVLNL